jgi:hypothetical protein
MLNGDAFDSRPDPALGAMLQNHLDGDRDNAEFAARVLAHLPSAGNLWETLARWSRPGIAALILVSALMGYWVVVRESRAVEPDSPGELTAVDRPLDNDAMLSVVLGTAR